MVQKRLCKSKTISSEKVAEMTEFALPQIKFEAKRLIFLAGRLPESCGKEAVGIVESGYRILSINNNLEEYFRIVSGRYSLENQVVELGEFCNNICEKLLPVINSRGMTFSHSITKEKTVVLTDKLRFQSAVLGVINNAVKHSEQGGKISLKLTATKKFAKITVHDRGEGMNAEVLSKCCDPFYSSGKAGAMGLGLTLAKHFAKESGGNIKIDSVLGGGTTVEIKIPLYMGSCELCAYDQNRHKCDEDLIKAAFAWL